MTAHAIEHVNSKAHEEMVDRKLRVTKEKKSLEEKVSFNLILMAYKQILSGNRLTKSSRSDTFSLARRRREFSSTRLRKL